MKRIGSLFTLLILSVVLLVSCDEMDDSAFDDALLIGKWQSGTLFYTYEYDGSGATWDEGDDVHEDEAQRFTWTLVNAELTQIHIFESSESTVTKVYTLNTLTETNLQYEDVFGKQFSFTKVTTSP
ncbi:MAG: hypothetical protein JXR50_07775 [Prolixibacteraceae bacterium]|nr:hypothetical protein [Prolixibacteraceae bacterium]MBN2649622.1 hypothetical protein [Prolixibacteraceae bacterium]